VVRFVSYFRDGFTRLEFINRRIFIVFIVRHIRAYHVNKLFYWYMFCYLYKTWPFY